MLIYTALQLTRSVTKGQLISKCLFGVSNFFQKINENKSHSSKNEFIRSAWQLLSKLTRNFSKTDNSEH